MPLLLLLRFLRRSQLIRMKANLHETTDADSAVVQSATGADVKAPVAVELAAGKLAELLGVAW